MMLGRECFVHTQHDEPQPIERHHVRPASRGGGDQQTIALCANAHGRVHALLEEIEAVAAASPFATPGEILRQIPDDLWPGYLIEERAVAFHGWEAYGLGFLNDRYTTAYHLWRTDGTPKQLDVPMFADLGHAARWSKRWRKELDAL